MIKSISLEDISITADKDFVNTTWDKLGIIANAKRSSGKYAVEIKKTYGFNEVIGRAFEVNVLEFAR